jgi:hypothetical protein
MPRIASEGSASCGHVAYHTRRKRIATGVIAVLFISASLAIVWTARNKPVINVIHEVVVAPGGGHIAILGSNQNRDVVETVKEYFEIYGEPEPWSIVTMSVHERASKQIASAGPNTIAWSPDSTHLFYVSKESLALPLQCEISRVNVNDGLVEKISTQNSWGIRGMKFSPDGRYVAFVELPSRQLTILNTSSPEDELSLQPSGTAPLLGSSWCWGMDSDRVYLIRDEKKIVEIELQDQSEQALYTFQSARTTSHGMGELVASPERGTLGFFADGMFYELNVDTGVARSRFSRDHYFGSIDWNQTGICYIDKVNGERVSHGRLMYYDPGGMEEHEIAVGPYSMPRWLNRKEIVVRKNNAEVWVFNVTTERKRQIYP